MKTDPTPLHLALDELATTMAPNPDRLGQVRRRVERRRRRRMATGAAVSAGAVAAAVGIAMVPREPRSTLQFNVAGPALPECASVAAPAAVAPKSNAVEPAEPDAVVRYKGIAVVSAVGAGTLTLGTFSEPGLLPSADSVVMTVDSATRFENNGPVATTPEMQVGQRVAFAASIGADGSTHLDYLDLGLDVAKTAHDVANESVQPTDDIKAALIAGGAKDEVPNDGVLRGKDVLAAAPAGNEVVVQAPGDGGDPRPVRLVLDSATQYFRFDTACATPELVAGTAFMFSAVPNGDGAYTATEIRIYN